MFGSRMENDFTEATTTSVHYFRLCILGPAIWFAIVGSLAVMIAEFLDRGPLDLNSFLVLRLMGIVWGFWVPGSGH